MAGQEPQLLQSPNDKKCYRRINLSNGLTCLLIHDPEIELSGDQDGSELWSSGSFKGEPSDSEEEGEEEEDDDDDEMLEDGDNEAEGALKKAAVAMAVNVGSFSDPDEIPGLSHYLEHMLFMGSEKFPDENDYEAYLNKHGGYSNAFTEQEHTVYYFDVNPRFLYDALDRFAQFFVAPLCKVESLEREVEAVENEFNSSLQDDYCRGFQLLSHTARAAHPMSKFSWGNKKCLWDDPKAQGVDIRTEVMKYYRSQYGAERMSLVVLGGEPLDTLEEWVRKLLCIVPSGVGPPTSFHGHGYPFEGQNMYVIPSVKDHHSVTVTFQLPPLTKMYKKKAEDYISHLLGHEGRGSLLSALKEKRWAVECEAGIDDSGESMNSSVYIFDVTLTLTDAGLDAAPGFGLAPVMMVFQYLKMLQNQEPQEWVFEEMKSVGEMKFRFLEESDAANYVTQLSTAPFFVAPEHVLISSYLYEEWDPNLVSDLLKQMVPTAPGLRIDLKSRRAWEMRSKLLETYEGSKILLEPWFDFEYVKLPLSEDIKKSWIDATVPKELGLPPRNPYIPTDFALKSSTSANGSVTDNTDPELKRDGSSPGSGVPLVPDLICDESGLRVWHKLDETYQSPKTNVFMRVYSPVVYDTPRNVACLHMMLAVWEETLNKELYLADVAGLHTGFYAKGASGFDVQISGFSDKLDLLVVRVVEYLPAFKVNEETFSILHEVMVRKLENKNMEVDKHSDYLRVYALSDGSWDCKEILDELRNVKLQDVKEYASLLLEGIHVEVLIHGNADKSEALKLSRNIRKGFGSGVLEAGARQVVRCTELAVGSRYVHRVDAKNQEERNSAMELYFQFGPVTPKQKALADLVHQMLSEPCFTTLRTIEQLGYNVDCSPRMTYGVSGLCFSIISEKYAPFHLENRVDAFLQQFEEMLREMSSKEFNEHREALIADNLQKDRSLAQASSRLWGHISDGRYEFDSCRLQVQELQKLCKKDVEVWYKKHLSPSSTVRRMLLVNVVCKPLCVAEAEANPPLSILTSVQAPNLQELRERLPKFPSMTRELSSISGIRTNLAKAVLNPRSSFGRVLRFR